MQRGSVPPQLPEPGGAAVVVCLHFVSPALFGARPQSLQTCCNLVMMPFILSKPQGIQDLFSLRLEPKDFATIYKDLLFVFPTIMKYVPGPHRKIYKNYLKLGAFVAKRLKENKETLDPNHPRDFIDSFLSKIEQEKKNPNSHFNYETMLKTTVNVFFAGTETVGSTLRYGFRILLRHPEVEGNKR